MNNKGYDIANDLKCKFSVDLEFVLSANKKYTLGSSQQLNKPSVRLYGIIAFINDYQLYSPTGNDIASLETYQQAYLTLQDPGSNNIFQQRSLGLFIPNTEIKAPFDFNGQQIDFTKSYFEFPSGFDYSADYTKSIVLTVEYIDVNLSLN